MTNKCLFKGGFFILRDCENPAMTACNKCGKPACNAHLSSESKYTTCIECSAKSTKTRHYYDHNDWVYSYRHQYYLAGYLPFMYGSQDYLSFKSQYEEGDDFDDDGADFLDS